MFVSDAIHKAVISVDEFGTEAAGATGMVMMTRLALIPTRKPKPVIFHVDQPCSFFIFSRRDPLFAGRIMSPNSE